ncbi:PREDICTED: telomerase Cajal body protein 1 isoform X1 [Polistes canadensis]|uniref:telomerase Cajal body protein 1 isoform X1 n=1 Tax=Polistes canadensis TaxID=91411 RepID=UPI000718B6B0|nr:PREDICTED: telomerase Cajal body protein 1 isoform X1 [Polistes canadensis]
MECESVNKTDLISLIKDENTLHMDIEFVNPAFKNIFISPTISIKKTENKREQSSNNETNVETIQKSCIPDNTNEISIDHAPYIESGVPSELNMEKIEPNLCEKIEVDNIDLTSKNTTDDSFCSCNWIVSPKLICIATKEYQPTTSCENFTKGCQWSPDDTCLLVPSEDFRIRLYELPSTFYSNKIPLDFTTLDLKAAVVVKEGGLVYDTCWYPFMNSWNPATCCFLSTSKESPIHLWDAFTGELRATYRAYNDVDEVAAAISVQFIDYGKQIFSGFKNTLHIFDTNYPGRQIETINFKKDFPNTSGLVSCIRENPLMPGLVAFGTYSKSIGLYKDTPICTFKTASGVTQIEFSPCGTKLYSAVRRSNEFLCWDLRNPGTVLYSFQKRQADTNQRIQFDITSHGRHLISGGVDGKINIWELLEGKNEDEIENPKYEFKISEDSVNGVSIHKNLPIVATSSGQRICDIEGVNRDNSVKLWWFN